MWSVWARWASATGLFAALLTSLQLAGDRGQPSALAIWLGMLLACWALGEAARLVVTRPVTAGLIGSKLEIPFPTRDLKARLCVRADRLVLDSLTSRRKRSRDVIAVPWAALRSIELVEVEQEMVCQVLVFSNSHEANAREFDVRPGPALHVIGTARELLIPVTEQVGRTALAAIRARSAGIEPEEPLTEKDWSRETGVYRGDSPKGNYRTDGRPYILGVVGIFLLMPLFMLSGMTLSLITGSARMQDQFYAHGGVVKPANVVVLGVGSIVFLYLLNRLVIKAFIQHMKVQDYIEAFPEPPPPPPKAGTVPGSGRKRKRHR
ncbi:hypothetical protein [Lentzea sp. NPDC004782]|uniref:hypothetical protein n=1 Tax=Lentzea sp. NPDC004782 TaxID=3154458 RepID=UPI0033AE3014